ncbi:hypothetical protein BKA63DRAFT_574192 [Paraphoma chrysanthemicola]|nr:hypothetical protein BKA63DRAFT_574192 [Paraphoma chrysanthemicola]
MATQDPSPRAYTKEELEETVDVEIVEANERRTFKMLRIHLDKYTPSLAGLFKLKGVKAVQLGNVSIQTVEHFLSWIGTEFAATCLAHHGQGRWKNLPFYPEAYEIPKLRQDPINRIIWYHKAAQDEAGLNGYIATSCIEAVYEPTKPYNVIRSLLVDGYCESGLTYDKKAVMNLPKEIIVDMVRHMAGKPVQRQYLDAPCNYHRHTSMAEKKGCEVRVWMERRREE